jgi:membrane protein implicated in regulation of membrane protease activity
VNDQRIPPHVVILEALKGVALTIAFVRFAVVAAIGIALLVMGNTMARVIGVAGLVLLAAVTIRAARRRGQPTRAE